MSSMGGIGRLGAFAKAAMVLGVTGALAGTFLVALPGTAYAAGTTWYVATTGTDTTTCTTPTAPCKTITQALTNAANGDTISVAAGTYTKPLVVSKAVTITGAGSGSTIISGGETTPASTDTSAMEVDLSSGATATLTVSGVTIEQGISKFGGGIELLLGNMVVNNSIVTANEAGGISGSTGGGGIAVFGSDFGGTSLTLNNDTVSNNKTVAFSTTNYSGGGIYSAGPVTLNSTVISGNSTAGSEYGGGILLIKLVAADTPSLTANASQITGNSSVVGGGIANWSAGQVTLNNGSAVTSNTGTDGAGIYTASTVTLNDASVSSNTASYEGGGFYASQVATTDAPLITASNNTIVSGNSAAVAGGGGLLFSGSTFNMNGGSLSSNTTSIVGGGLYVSAGNTATLTGTTVSNNSGADGGGIAIAGGGSTSLVGAAVSNNVASSGSTANEGLGGGIFDAGALSITGGSTLSGNQAIADTSGGSVATGWGGAVFAGPSGAGNAPTFALTNSTVTGGTLASGTNAAIGGGIAIVGNVLGTVGSGFAATPATFTGTGDTFSGLTAIYGGGAYVGGTGSFTGSTFSNDTASGSSLSLGGGLFVGKGVASDPATATVDSSTFSSDSAALGGGAGVNSSSTLTLQNGTVFNSNQATNSGGGLYLGGSATVSNTTFENGTAAEFSGGIFDASVVSTDTPVFTGTDVDINSNTSLFEGGGVTVGDNATFDLTGGSIDENSSLLAGGLLTVPGSKTAITGADLSGNTASAGDGGGVFNEGVLGITNTSLDNNKAVASSSDPTTTGFGGAIYSGTSTASSTTSLTMVGDTLTGNNASAASVLLTLSSGSSDVNASSITNSTITGNTTGPSYGTIDAFDPVTIVFSTINGNTSPSGASGGLYVEASGAISVAGSAISGNTGGNCSTKVVDGGYNLTDSGDSSCGFTAAKDDVSGNPQLGPLAANGGPTLTELPAASSPLINKIPPNTATGLSDAVSGNPVVLCATGSVDQRGSTRPQGPSCDIGSVEVGVSAPSLSGPSAATFLVGSAGTAQVFTATGTPTPKLTESGALPNGVTFTDNGNGTATLQGTPASGTVGTYAITVTAANGTLPNASLHFTLTVDQAPSLSGPSSDTYTVNSPGSDTFVATGTPTPSLSESGALPTGVTFTDNGGGTGTLAGTPKPGTQGTYALVITASNGEGTNATIDFTLTVLPPVTITTTSLSGGTVGVAYTATLAAVNGVKPYTWSLASGTLPAGLTLASNGTISGMPTGPGGTSSFVVEVTDSASPPGTASQALSISIAKGTTALAVNPVILGPPLVLTIGSVSATLTGGSPAEGIAGQTVTFTSGSTVICSGVTSSSGAVTCNFTVTSLLVLILADGVTATYAGSTSWLPSSGSSSLIG